VRRDGFEPPMPEDGDFTGRCNNRSATDAFKVMNAPDSNQAVSGSTRAVNPAGRRASYYTTFITEGRAGIGPANT
jgi:hypothetical protein